MSLWPWSDGGEAIGYNQTEAMNVIEQMKGGLTALKTAMEDNWSTMATTFQTNWVGEDEAAFEKTFAEELGKMYTNCDTVVGSAMKFIVDAANAWADWQTGVANQFAGGTVAKLDEYSHQADTISITPAEQSFDQSTTRGLQSGDAQNALVQSIEEYVNIVQGAFDGIYSTIETGKAFVGSEQAGAMNEFIHGLSESMRLVLKMVDTFKEETIPQLVQAYGSQQTTVAGDANSAGQAINDSISGASTGA